MWKALVVLGNQLCERDHNAAQEHKKRWKRGGLLAWLIDEVLQRRDEKLRSERKRRQPLDYDREFNTE
jgi:hypothetical protein